MKGSMIDYFFIIVLVLIFGIFILVGTYIKDAIFPQLSTALNDVGATAALNTVSNEFSIFDEIFLFFFIAMSTVPIVFAFLIPTHPVLIFVNIILLIIYILIVPTISNVMQQFWSSAPFTQYATGGTGSTTFVIMTSVFQYLPIIACGFSFILMIVLFAKSEGRGA